MNVQYISLFSQIVSVARKHSIPNVEHVHNAIVLSRAISNTRTCTKYRREPTVETETLGTKHKLCKHFTTIGKVFNNFSPKTFGGTNKVSVIGLDDIGIATVFTLLTKNITDNICMIDLNEDVLKGEQIDIQFSSLFLNNPKITSSKDPSATRDSKVCVVTTGTFKGREEHDTEYISRNVGIIRAIVPALMKHSPDAIFIVASDPVDILSYATWKLSGTSKHRVIGTGTMLDTARFRYLLSEMLGVAPTCCHGYIIGQHGVNSVPLWSTVNVGGVRLVDINPTIGTANDSENWKDTHTEVVKSDDLIRDLKGSVSWAIALAIGELCQAIFTNANTVIPVSTYVKGEHGVREDVFLSLPCVIGASGVSDIIRQTLSEEETLLFRRGADNVAEMRGIAAKLLC